MAALAIADQRVSESGVTSERQQQDATSPRRVDDAKAPATAAQLQENIRLGNELASAALGPVGHTIVPSHLEEAISRTQNLLKEVQGWSNLAGDESPATQPACSTTQ